MVKSMILGINEGESYWQPMPANGYITIKLTPELTNNVNFAMGIQVLPPGGNVREHFHDSQDEIIFCFSGSGKAIINGESHEFTPGTTVFLSRKDKHQFINDGEVDLKFTWTILPHGLENFFRKIGQLRDFNETKREQFDRPQNIDNIERESGFGKILL